MQHPLTAAEVVEALGMSPHPEGGFYKEIFRAAPTASAPADARGVATSIYFLLPAGVRSHWHTVDAVEIWNYHAGAPLDLLISTDEVTVERLRLGANLAGGERPQGIVPAGAWQAAESLGEWTLAGCTVAPAFQFSGFRMAPEGWAPGAPLP